MDAALDQIAVLLLAVGKAAVDSCDHSLPCSSHAEDQSHLSMRSASSANVSCLMMPSLFPFFRIAELCLFRTLVPDTTRSSGVCTCALFLAAVPFARV
ncbi:hypothetical protein PF008_g2455 [Phytophthora fragariae]|uniref:Uncharacterized protein n=1 Tax=Phytophthora fragariae TaxID=53985 RepID=A0A6G0SIV6_9STRA|nr:hypothetical protein PF008_g2455 [Phytophthora fragariae]